MRTLKKDRRAHTGRVRTDSEEELHALEAAAAKAQRALAQAKKKAKMRKATKRSLFKDATDEKKALRPFVGKKKLALVIGNTYKKSGCGLLDNPENDAKDIALTLRSIGFEVTLKLNLRSDCMEDVALEWSEKIDKDTIALFHFSGHGVQHSGKDWLVPDDGIKHAKQLKSKAKSVQDMQEYIAYENPFASVMILDCCRNLSKSMKGLNNLRGAKRAMRSSYAEACPIESLNSLGSLIMYATAKGDVAMDSSWDGSGRNGLFTKHVLKHMTDPSKHLEAMASAVCSGVKTESGGTQIPWRSSCLGEESQMCSIAVKSVVPKPVESKSSESPEPLSPIELLCDLFDSNEVQSPGDSSPTEKFILTQMLKKIEEDRAREQLENRRKLEVLAAEMERERQLRKKVEEENARKQQMQMEAFERARAQIVFQHNQAQYTQPFSNGITQHPQYYSAPVRRTRSIAPSGRRRLGQTATTGKACKNCSAGRGCRWAGQGRPGHN